MSNVILLLYVFATSFGLIVLKLGTRESSPTIGLASGLPVNISWMTLLGILLYGISFLLYVYLISKYDLSYILPLTASLAYIVVFLASYFILKEPFTAAKVTGAFLIMFGLFFLNQGK